MTIFLWQDSWNQPWSTNHFIYILTFWKYQRSIINFEFFINVVNQVNCANEKSKQRQHYLARSMQVEAVHVHACMRLPGGSVQGVGARMRIKCRHQYIPSPASIERPRP